MSENCPICGKKLTMMNTGVGGRLASGEKLCIPCLNRASRYNPEMTLHCKQFTADEVRSWFSATPGQETAAPQSTATGSATAPANTPPPPKKKGCLHAFIGLLIIGVVAYFVINLFQEPDIKTQPEQTSLAKRITYQVTSETESDIYSKGEVIINLSDKADESAIRQIAEKYKKKYIPKYRRAFIYFYVADYRDCYATAHCEPEMDIKFLPMSDRKAPVIHANFYTFEKTTTWTPDSPQGRMARYINLMRTDQTENLVKMTQKEYADSKKLTQILSPYTDVKGFRVDSVSTSECMSKVYFYLCYSQKDKDVTKRFYTTLYRADEQGNPDINAKWTIDPYFTCCD